MSRKHDRWRRLVNWDLRDKRRHYRQGWRTQVMHRGKWHTLTLYEELNGFNPPTTNPATREGV